MEAACAFNQRYVDKLLEKQEAMQNATFAASRYQRANYGRAARSVSLCPFPLKTVKDFTKLKSVGNGIAKMLMETGRRMNKPVVCSPPTMPKVDENMLKCLETARQIGSAQKEGAAEKINLEKGSVNWAIMCTVYQTTTKKRLQIEAIVTYSKMLVENIETTTSVVDQGLCTLRIHGLVKKMKPRGGAEYVYYVTPQGRKLIESSQDFQVVEISEEHFSTPVIKEGVATSLSSSSKGKNKLRSGVINVNEDKRPVFTFTPAKTAVFTPAPLRKRSGVLSPVHGEWEVVLLLDKSETVAKRERDVLCSKLFELGVLVESRRLALGDVLWIFRRTNDPSKEYVSDYIVERKEVQDLASSIKDKRYAEQKFRLHRCGLQRIIYLVEGDIRNISGLPVKALETSMAMTQLVDGFMVEYSASVSDTIAFYARIHSLIKSLTTHAPPGKWDGPNISDSWRQYKVFHQHNGKSKLKTVKEIFSAQLGQIRGFSVNKASAVVDRFPTPTDLFNLYENYEMNDAPVDVKKLALQNLKSENTNQRVGQVASCRVHDMYTMK